jgi:hypothetical protein
VEIDLWPSRLESSLLFLPRAATTVVEYDDQIVKFTPARSWVNITGLTIPQTYNFKIYTEDEFGNPSIPIEASGKPFTDADKGALKVPSVITSSATQGAFVPTPATNLYDLFSISYSYRDKDGVLIENKTKNVTTAYILSNLAAASTTPLHITYEFKPKNMIDTVVVSETVEIKTRTQEEFDAFMNSSQPFPKAGYTHTVSATSPLDIMAADFDMGGNHKGYFILRVEGPHPNGSAPVLNRPADYRTQWGDLNSNYCGIYIGTGNVELYGTKIYGIGGAWNEDWYNYTIEVEDAGTYKIEYRVGMNWGGSALGQAKIAFDNMDIAYIPISPTGVWNNWDRLYDSNISIYLSQGIHKFRWTMLGGTITHDFGGLRFSWLDPQP